MNSRYPVLMLKKSLVQQADRNLPDGPWEIRGYGGTDEDARQWLAVQNAAFAQFRAARPWGLAEFHRELVARPWWSPARLWLVRPRDSDDQGTLRPVIATVALELTATVGQLHWLAVHPAFQGRGLARRLVATAESECLRHQVTQIVAETLRGSSAERFYRQCGFSPVGEACSAGGAAARGQPGAERQQAD